MQARPTREEIVAANPIDQYLAAAGVALVKSGTKHVCKCPFHDDKTPSMSVDVGQGVWYCHACGFGGSVIDLVIRMKGVSVKEAMHQLADSAHLIRKEDFETPCKVATYEYKDQHGRPVMKVDRIEQGLKKRFLQYHEDDKGQRINGIDGVQRTLYRLEKWAGLSEVHLVEGEKCVEYMERVGFNATCNPGGSSAWCDAYAVYLKDKHVTVWPDRDEPGAKWTAAVLKSLEGTVASLRVVHVPPPYNDIADMIIAQGEEIAPDMITALADKVPRLTRGVSLPLLSSAECFDLYQKRVTAAEAQGIDLGKWLPSLKRWSRVLLPGDLGVFLSDTGVGKTSVLVNIACSQRPMPTIFFEIELDAAPMCERFIAHNERIPTLSVEGAVRKGEVFNTEAWDHVFICPESKMDLDRMEEIVSRAELKIGARPRLILVDYIGLMGCQSGGKRYERMSTLAEGLKVLARSTETVVIMASQVRRDPERQEIDLHDSKDSGSIENSAQLVMGAWKPNPDTMTIRILKQTKMAGQHDIQCRFDGDRQRVTEIYEPEGNQ
jgi:hypothetical protein